MHIEELEEEIVHGQQQHDGKPVLDVSNCVIHQSTAKRVLIGAGARFLFYPTLLYNVLRNRVESEFHWWDEVHEFVLLGAVPFPKDVPHLKQLGVRGVITLNEPYETLVPTSLYRVHGIDHLVIPTRDYLFAPSFESIFQAVGFIHENALHGKTTYVHCKAGRGRSTTIVLCYLVQHKRMTPREAYDHVRSRRTGALGCLPMAVQEYYKVVMWRGISKDEIISPLDKSLAPIGRFVVHGAIPVDDGSTVVVTDSDLDGYVECSSQTMEAVGGDLWTYASVLCRVQFAGQAALSRLWYAGLGHHSGSKVVGSPEGRWGSMEGAVDAEKTGGLGVDIPVC